MEYLLIFVFRYFVLNVLDVNLLLEDYWFVFEIGDEDFWWSGNEKLW